MYVRVNLPHGHETVHQSLRAETEYQQLLLKQHAATHATVALATVQCDLFLM